MESSRGVSGCCSMCRSVFFGLIDVYLPVAMRQLGGTVCGAFGGPCRFTSHAGHWRTTDATHQWRAHRPRFLP